MGVGGFQLYGSFGHSAASGSGPITSLSQWCTVFTRASTPPPGASYTPPVGSSPADLLSAKSQLRTYAADLVGQSREFASASAAAPALHIDGYMASTAARVTLAQARVLEQAEAVLAALPASASAQQIHAAIRAATSRAVLGLATATAAAERGVIPARTVASSKSIAAACPAQG